MRLALSGARYAGAGVTLRISRASATTVNTCQAAGDRLRAVMTGERKRGPKHLVSTLFSICRLPVI